MPVELKRAVLISLRPKYAELIYSGRKRGELRRTRPSRKITDVFVYETSPVKKITGWFRVLRVQTTSPSAAWKRFRKMLSITRAEFRAYLHGSKLATVYLIQFFRKFKAAVSLRKLVGHGRPPQSYRYLDSHATRSLLTTHS